MLNVLQRPEELHIATLQKHWSDTQQLLGRALSITTEQCVLLGSDQRRRRGPGSALGFGHIALCTMNREVQILLVRCREHNSYCCRQYRAPSHICPKDLGKIMVRKSACFNNTLNGLDRDSTTASSTSACADPDLFARKVSEACLCTHSSFRVQ